MITHLSLDQAEVIQLVQDATSRHAMNTGKLKKKFYISRQAMSRFGDHENVYPMKLEICGHRMTLDPKLEGVAVYCK